ncbi:MAG: ABC transporter permease, partial [Candidatus Acidiferrales bacterium]
MALLRVIGSGLRSLFGSKHEERELDEELRGFVEMAAAEKMKDGMTRAGALRAVRLERGSIEATKQEVRAAGWECIVETVWQDLHFGLRTLRKNLGFTVVAAGTLALAIGANTALFSVVKAVLLNSLPYREPQRLATLAEGRADTDNPTNVSYGEVEDWKARNAPFQQIALSGGWTPASSTDGHSEITYGLRVTQNFFELLGVSAAQGRLFLPEEDRPNRSNVVVLS